MKSLLIMGLVLMSFTSSARPVDQSSLKKVLSSIRIAQRENLRGNTEQVNTQLTNAIISLSPFIDTRREDRRRIEIVLLKNIITSSDCNMTYLGREIEDKLARQCEKENRDCDFDSITSSFNFKKAATGSVITSLGSCEVRANIESEF